MILTCTNPVRGNWVAPVHTAYSSTWLNSLFAYHKLKNTWCRVFLLLIEAGRFLLKKSSDITLNNQLYRSSKGYFYFFYQLLLSPILYYMACVCGRYNARSDCLNCRTSFSRSSHWPITGLQRQSKKPCSEQLVNIECSVLTRKSKTSALPHWPRYRSVNMVIKVSVWDTFL